MERKPAPITLIALVALIAGGGAVLWLVTRSGSDPRQPQAQLPDGQLPDVQRQDEAVDPTRFRQEGRTYAVKVLLNLHGRGTHEDWGLETVLSVNYAVTLRFDETVITSEPEKLIVERRFIEARSRLFTTVEDFDLSEDMKSAWRFLDYAAVIEPRIGQGKTVLSTGAARLKEKLLEESRRLGLNWSRALDTLGRDPTRALRQLTSKLEGRKVKLIWTAGEGVRVLSGADGLPEKERALLARASLLADGAIFPNKNKRHGERWNVDASHFTDFLDIGIDGALRGKVIVRRDADREVEGRRCAQLVLVGGTIDVVRDDASREQRGSLSPTGSFDFDLTDNLIRGAELAGKAKARVESRDHLLFRVRFKGTPEFKVAYEARLK